jgi:hypothetical protein
MADISNGEVVGLARIEDSAQLEGQRASHHSQEIFPPSKTTSVEGSKKPQICRKTESTESRRTKGASTWCK